MKIEIDNNEYDIEYNYSPPMAGRFYMNNGDPGYPDEPAEVEVTKLSLTVYGQTLEFDYDQLPEKIQDDIYNQICDFESDRESDEYAEKYERERD